MFRKLTSVIFPLNCWHCGCSGVKGPLCLSCQGLCALIPPNGRCPLCFAPTEAKGRCGECRQGYLRMAAAFEYEGPLVTLLHRFKYGGQFGLAKVLAAFLVVQLGQLEWDTIDCLVPVPQTVGHRVLRGYNPSALLAKAMGKLLKIPVYSALKRCGERMPQSTLTREDRLTLKADHFTIKHLDRIIDKRVLIIDDVITTGQTLGACALKLKEASPARLYGLACCINSL